MTIMKNNRVTIDPEKKGETADVFEIDHHHFGYLDRLQPGASVIFTDMEGAVYRYAVEGIRQLAPEDAEDVSAVFSSEYPLVLYTCTPGGKARVAVFCRWAETIE